MHARYLLCHRMRNGCRGPTAAAAARGRVPHQDGKGFNIVEQGNCLILKMIECDPAAVAKLVHRVRTKVTEDDLEEA